MSSSRNTNRLAKKIRNQTSLTLSTASRLARQANVYLGSSVTDATDPHQRRLEAHLAHVLASGFKDRQLNGALLGVREAKPDAQGLHLTLESEMADEFLRELLPRFDHFYGGVRGVPGLRVRGSNERVVLHDALSAAQVTVTRTDHSRMRLPSARDGEVLLWQRAPGGLSREEGQEAEEWVDSGGSADLRVRDLLLSRILRCPGVVNRTAEPHGFANCYTHHSGDLVIEWCCGDTMETLCANLLAHGIADGLPRRQAIELLSRHSAHLGDRTVILNRHNSCLCGRGAAEIAEYIRKGYES
ncbi:hypothetical protein [Streptomyces capitiformicae]|uniref:Uncharacterized protein n=1 Tax=Streptomyces capitiformicae TaxID=2014920 RepID=A0A919DPR7_9ACTN|nr:hypothetical protein [Streptomyces capitiformicae]GHE64416.1 hypothetical protein GCM10017771_87950 [Streptomyces capitiformicae]